jgi:hypothetical protein
MDINFTQINFMKPVVLFAFFLAVSLNAFAQSFPQDFIGKWEGDILWYQSPGKEPKKIAMQLSILPADSAHKFSWHMIYGSPTEDSRPYTLIAKDTTKGHWIIDEHNGIIIDEYWIAGRLTSMFTVQNSTIVNNYWIENGQLHAEFYTMSAKPIATTGKGDKEIPFVDSYQTKSYQKAILQKQ